MNKPTDANSKEKQLEKHYSENHGPGKKMTTTAGMKVSNNDWSLRAGKRGPRLFQDFHFYRKQSQFHRERIPEKVVHARGFGVHGVFESTKSMKEYTKAGFLQEPGIETPVFVRFSTFIGSKGSKDTAIDLRGFATKFYTEEGNYDNLALSFAPFVMADAMKFVDLVHAVKPNPVTDVPQAACAHDNFWDYVANQPESTHFVMWLMSGRGRSRSWRMMEGYPVNTFRFINEEGKSTFVKFVWKPKLGVHSLLLDETLIIGGVDPDFHRHDMIEAIEKKAYPEYDWGVQMIPEEDEFKYDFDILDPTKLWPEEVVPVEIIGKMTLNRLVQNAFAEEEQSVFDPSNLVPGINFSNDPVLQGRAFAYRDTNYHRLGTENIEEIPINNPIVETNYNNRDGFSKYRIDIGDVNYNDNSLAGNTPEVSSIEEGGYAHFPEEVEGHFTREVPSDSFTDYFSQSRLFWNSMSGIEKNHLIETFSYHLGKVKDVSVRQQNVDMFANVDKEMASQIANNIGVNPPKNSNVEINETSPVLSEANTIYSCYTQKVGILIGNGFDDEEVKSTLNILDQNGAFYEIIGEQLGAITSSSGTKLEVEKIFSTTHPVLVDSIYVVGGNSNDQIKFDRNIREFVEMAYKHHKPIGVATTGQSYIEGFQNLEGVIFAQDNPNFGEDFISAITQQRFWNRK
ncbi:MAG: catalase [Tissierellia bacterium]|nr:catalase [Tissierellia bacterium]